MATEIGVTDGAIRVTNAIAQPLHLAMNVSKVDQLDLLLQVLAAEGTAGSGFVIAILTGMQNETEEGWYTAATFNTAMGSNVMDLKNVKNLLKFARWKVVSMGSFAAVTFSVRGMGRMNG